MKAVIKNEQIFESWCKLKPYKEGFVIGIDITYLRRSLYPSYVKSIKHLSKVEKDKKIIKFNNILRTGFTGKYEYCCLIKDLKCPEFYMERLERFKNNDYDPDELFVTDKVNAYMKLDGPLKQIH